MAKIDPFDDGLPLPAYMRQVAFEMRDRFIADAAEPLRVYDSYVAYELARIVGGEERPRPEGTLNACDREKVQKARELRSMMEDESLKHFEREVIERVRAEGRSGKIKATIIDPKGAEAELPPTWWRGSEAAACLAGTPHPEGDLRIRRASQHELNTPDDRKSKALQWLRAEYPRRFGREESVTKSACMEAFEKETGIRIGEAAWKQIWGRWREEAKTRFPRIGKAGRPRKKKSTG
jgi:hypothetical protein